MSGERYSVHVTHGGGRDAVVIDAWEYEGREVRHLEVNPDGGLWQVAYQEGALSARPTLVIPGPYCRDFILALRDGLNEYLTNRVPDPGAEAKVLREWLAVERGRVDRLIEGRS